jgi:hypothetical protein
MQTEQSLLHPGPDPLRRRAHDHFLRVHVLREPVEVLVSERSQAIQALGWERTELVLGGA